MIFIQIAIYFNYQLLLYLIIRFEQVYETGIVAAVSEILAYVFSGCIFERLGIHRSYLLSLGISTLGGILIIVYGLDH